MHASAFVIGPDDGPGLALEELGWEMEFHTVRWFTDLADAEEQTKITPICFFLFSSGLDPKVIAETSGTIRSSRNRQAHFAPMVAFSESPSEKFISKALQSGFDDIISAPFTSLRVKPRLENLLARKVVFYETATYFGPDRRSHKFSAEHIHSERGRGGPHRRCEIIRETNTGIRVLSDRQINELTQ